jgi:hypothetical protein
MQANVEREFFICIVAPLGVGLQEHLQAIVIHAVSEIGSARDQDDAVVQGLVIGVGRKAKLQILAGTQLVAVGKM